jgi:DAACS family dicarboxylate/amino acid:cation (Na+ or H+) symporter
MAAGVITGMVWGPSLAPLGAIGKLVIQLIKGFAVPLVFIAIVEAILCNDVAWRGAWRLIIVVSINAICAASIALLISHLIQPGSYLSLAEHTKIVGGPIDKTLIAKEITFAETITGYLPHNIVQPFLEGNVLAVVILAILFGTALKSVRATSAPKGHDLQILDEVFTALYKTFETILLWLVHLIPLAVFGVVCKTVGEYGLEPFKGLAVYVGVCLLGLSLQIIIVYQIWISLIAKISLPRFWGEAKGPLFYSFGTNSSLATLPLTLRTLDSLGVSKASSRLGACVGTNFNNDGILLYEAMAVMFVTQALGIELAFDQQIAILFSCVIAAIGVAGIPEAGIISLSLVLTSAGLPIETLPLLLTVDWIVARARSATNVMSDMTVSIALDALDKPRTNP